MRPTNSCASGSSSTRRTLRSDIADLLELLGKLWYIDQDAKQVFDEAGSGQWLRNVVIVPGCNCPLPIARHCIRSQGDGRNITGRKVYAEILDEIPAVR